jgi:transcriptional regulator with XRE-family HTH domain
MRTQAGLTQRQLAAKLGTTASVICRLEDADYEGHSLAMLRRIAEVLGKRIEIRFVPADKPKRRSSRRVA